jgi:hypothetical protein
LTSPADATDYHVWKVYADPGLVPTANQYGAQGSAAIVPACAESPLTSCTDAGAVARSPRLVLYQVRGACICTPLHYEGIGHPPAVSCP